MHKIGKQTVCFDNPPIILQTASIVGPKEANGPMASYFDKCLEDEVWGEKSWEKAESKIIKETIFEKQCKFSQNIDWRRTSSRFIVTVGLSCNIESFGNVGLIEMFLTTRNF